MPRKAMRRWGLAVVHGRSMLPTLREGDVLLVRHDARPRTGRLAVVRLPDGVLAVKRVTGREPGGWWVEADNRRAAGVSDSWRWGTVADEDVVAAVLLRLWPPRRSRT